MPEYNCILCNFSTKNKTLYQRHLKCKKHIKLTSNLPTKNGDIHISPHFSTFSPHFSTFSPHFSKTPKNTPKYTCQFCNKNFTRSDSLLRHINGNCKGIEKVKPPSPSVDNQYHELLKLLEKEREDHKEQIDKMIDKVGNTTIHNQMNNVTQTNNVNLNNYGSENLDMLTDKFMKKMVTFPYTAIPKLIKKIHFNENYPENQNIRMLNKKDGKLQILQKDKWTYVDKKEHISQLIDDKNYILDRYYENNKKNFNPNLQTRFDNFQYNYSVNDKDIRKENNKETELVFWNSM